jgi:SAM-dependent methyltransferase
MQPDRDDYDPFARYYDLFYGLQADDLPMYRDFALSADGPILEIGCGTGRVLVPLAAEGHVVTGLDASAAMLALTRAKARANHVEDRVTLLQGDMRDFEMPGRFGLAFSAINTFMHCHDMEQQLACLRCIRRHLQPGGQLVVDLFHPDLQTLLECDGRLLSRGELRDPDTGHIVQHVFARRLELATQTQQLNYLMDEIDASGVVHRACFSLQVRFVYRYEMELLLRLAGFSLETVYGSYELEPFDSGSEKMIFVARTDR